MNPIRIWFGNNPRPNWDLICGTIVEDSIDGVLEAIAVWKENKIFLCLDAVEQEELKLAEFLFENRIFIFKTIICNPNHEKVYSFLQQNGYRVEYLPVTQLTITKGCC